jgi:hypothetical protein
MDGKTPAHPPLSRPAPHGRGFALFSVLLIIVLFATMATGALIASNIGLRSSVHYRTGHQAFYAVESGVLHALGVINGRGVQDFSADIANTTQWARLFSPGEFALPSDATSSYIATVAADPADPINRGSITAVGSGPLEAEHLLTVRLRKGIIADQGALYLANDAVDASFGARDQFEIDGNDHNMDTTLNPGGPLRPGISTRNDTVRDAAKAELSDPQKMKVKGLGFSLDPLDPSVMTTAGPTVTDLEQIVDRILSSNPVTEIGDAVLPSGTYGTIDAPQVTHLTNKNVRLDGTMTGAGILIADGQFTINGSANFVGWVIVRGPTVLQSGTLPDGTLTDGNATIVGSLWSGDLVVQVGGSAIIDFCDSCMRLADSAGNGQNAPRVMSVISWQEGS